MKVLLIGSEPERMTRLRRTHNSLKELGVDVKIFNPYREPSGRPRIMKGIIRYLVIMLQVLFSKADVYHFYNVPDVIGLPLLLKRGTMIYDVRSPWFSSIKETLGVSVLSKLACFVEWIMTRGAGFVLTANTLMAERARIWGAERVVVVPNYPPREFGPTQSREAMRQHLKLGNSPTVMYLGKISRLEGSELLKDIILKTCRAIPDVRFVIVGDGPRKDSLVSFVERNGLLDQVLFLGWVPHDQVADYIIAADVGLLPRTWTTFSPYTSPENILKAGEYLALGIPLIAPKMGGFATASFPVIPAEPAEMANALIDFLRNPQPVEEQERPTWAISHRRLRGVYSEIGLIQS